MPIVRLLASDHVRDGSVRTNSQDGVFPACHLADPVRGRTWRSTDATAGRFFIADLTQAYSIQGLALIGANLTTNASVLLEAASSSGLLSTTSSTSASAAIGLALTPWSADRTCCLVWMTTGALPSTGAYEYKHWRVLITDSGNSAGYLEIGRAILSSAVAMTLGPQQLAYTVVDPSVTAYSVGGTPWTFERSPYTVVGLPHRFLAEALIFGSLQDAVRTLRKRDGVLSLYSSEPACSCAAIATNLYGRLVEDPQFTYVLPAEYDGALVFRESL